MAQDRTRLSIVAPAYDEEEVLPHFHRELCLVLAGLEGTYDVEVLYVDDGSRDGTLALLRAWGAADPRVRYLSFSRNFGHQAAFTAGLEHARGDLVVMLDADLQHPPSLIPALLGKAREGFDVVRTVRPPSRRGGRLEGWASRWFVRLFRWMSATPVGEDVSDFCLLSRRAVDALLRLREAHRYLRGLVQWLGFPAAEVAFRPAERRAGVSKFSPPRLAGYALDALLSFSRVPLRLAGLLGLLFLLLGLGFGVHAAVAVALGHGAGWSALLGSVYAVGGAVLCGLGAVGEYVGRIYEQVKGRPLYVVKETEADRAALARSASAPAPPSAAA